MIPVPRGATTRGLAQRLWGEAASDDAVPPIVPTGREGNKPLSFAQQRIWFFEQLFPGNPVYHVANLFRVRGPLDASALRVAFEGLIARHAILRTIYPDDGLPVQKIFNTLPAPFHFVDLSGKAEAVRESEALDWATNEARRPFDIARDVPMRVFAIRLAPAEHLVGIVFHHIASDGTSFGIAFTELGALYGRAQGGDMQLPGLGCEYADFAVWQRELLAGNTLDKQLRYWVNRLKTGGEELRLPLDRPRPATCRYVGSRVYRPDLLNAETTSALRALAKPAGATFFMALIAVYSGLLHRYTGQNEIVVGFPVGGRARPELEHVFGCFINMCVLCVDFSDKPNFLELLARVRANLLETYDNQDIPFEKIVERVAPRRSLATTPVFNVMMNLRSIRTPRFHLHGADVEELPFDFGIANFDQTFELTETADGVSAKLQYNSDIFDPGTIDTMLRRYAALVRGVVKNPESPIATIPFE